MMNLFIVGRLFLCSRDQGVGAHFPLGSSGAVGAHFPLGSSGAVGAYFNQVAAVQGQRCQLPNKKYPPHCGYLSYIKIQLSPYQQLDLTFLRREINSDKWFAQNLSILIQNIGWQWGVGLEGRNHITGIVSFR